MLTIAPLDSHAVEHVVANLWERGQVEARRFGFEPGPKLVAAIADLTNEYAFAVLNDKEPVAVCGASPVNPYHYRTWFLATDAFNEHGATLTRLVRHHLIKQSRRHPHVTLEAVSANDDPAAAFWFHVIGFRLIAETGGMKVYRYVSDSPRSAA